ncbi:MAG: preprotein translocase subunit SecY [Acidimicrobiia bacterium]
MLHSLLNMFRVQDLRKKILFVLFIIAVYRLGAHIPVPGISIEGVRNLQEQSAANNSGILNLLNLFSGGALTHVAIFALGIMPNITASIIMQLLQVVIPKLEQWREEGELGQKKITQATRYLTLVLALIQSAGLAYLLSTGQLGQGGAKVEGILGPDPALWRYGLIVVTMTTGTVLIMWLGELITQRGIGNGMSLLIFASVLSQLPSQFAAVFQSNFSVGVLLCVIALGMIVGIVFIESGERRIQVQFAKRIVGRRMTSGGSTYIPLKVNTGGVIPIIFASSVLYIPTLFASALPWAWLQNFVRDFVTNQKSWFYVASYFLLVIGFSYFYNMIQFDPYRNAEFLKKQGGYIPGVRPGKQTAEYFHRILNRLTLPGALYLASIAIIPVLVLAFSGVQAFPFGGTSMLIAVGVALETMKQIDSQLMMRNYEGFLAGSRPK